MIQETEGAKEGTKGETDGSKKYTKGETKRETEGAKENTKVITVKSHCHGVPTLLIEHLN